MFFRINIVFPSKKNDKSGDLWKSDIDKCCNLRKVLPLEKALIPFKAWISGRKSYHMNKRQDLQVFEKINDFFLCFLASCFLR